MKVKLTEIADWTIRRFERKSQEFLLGWDLINQKDSSAVDEVRRAVGWGAGSREGRGGMGGQELGHGHDSC